MIFWFKVATTGMIIYYINNYQRKAFFYYQNLGLSKRFLWTYTLCFDWVLFIIALLIIYKFK